MYDKKKFIETLKSMLEEKEMSQKELSKAVGCNQSTVSGYMTGRFEPSDERVKEICEVVGMDADQFEMNPREDSKKLERINMRCMAAINEAGFNSGFFSKNKYEKVTELCNDIFKILEG